MSGPIPSKEFIKTEERAGRRIVLPAPNQLFIDIDTNEAYEHFKKQLSILDESVGTKMQEYPSKSGLPHRHITITLDFAVLHSWQRLALQAALGSDPIREVLACVQLLYGDENPSLFSEEPASS